MKAKILLPLFVVLFIAANKKQDAAKKDQERLQGTWVVFSAEKDGKPLDRIKGASLPSPRTASPSRQPAERS